MLEKTCLAIAAEDQAGQRWAREHGYGGYTSYASLNDLTRRASVLRRTGTRHRQACRGLRARCCNSIWAGASSSWTVSGSM